MAGRLHERYRVNLEATITDIAAQDRVASGPIVDISQSGLCAIVSLHFATGAIVMATASDVAHERAWKAETITSLVLVLLMGLAMVGVTYYYHLHEDDDDAGGDGVAHFLVAPCGQCELAQRGCRSL
jgi:hypothetical protein